MDRKELLTLALLALAGGMSLLVFLAMGWDKRLAKANERRARSGKAPRRRIPERTLFLLAALGGAPGALLGMYAFRHKTKHRAFTLGVPLLLAAQLALALLLAKAL